jgi:hypothetical protein
VSLIKGSLAIIVNDASRSRARFFGFSTMAVSAWKPQRVTAYGVSLSWLQAT